MTRRRIAGAVGVLALCAVALSAAAFSLRTYGPEESWNVFAASTPTYTPTATPTFTSTPTSTPTHTPTPTNTPLPTSTPIPPPDPPEIPGPEVAGERWILVDLAAQTTSAMVGEETYYTSLVTTGKDGWNTPPGEFRILYRVPNETMASAAIGAEEYYDLKDVLYTQYFTDRGHALHLNYWREPYYFGNIRSSHGCVGMRLEDAEFFWNFATLGTRVVIR